MRMVYTDKNQEYEYVLVTDPPEAMYWSTTKLKKTDIQVLNVKPKAKANQIREEIFNDIVSTEGNPPQKPHRVRKKRKSSNDNDAQTRQEQQKTRRRNPKT